ncbi:MAG: hypothetical protein N3A59_08675 [Thermodesulfovibrionales bacterium]|nr:hypothetical protein [Thermodesulfovibrionales bacterium]
MIELLKYQIAFFGIEAPWFSWVAALGLLIWPAYEFFKLIKICNKRSKILSEISDDIKNLSNNNRPRFGEGIPISVLDEIRVIFQKNHDIANFWYFFEKSLIYRRIEGKDQDHVWATESAENSINDEFVLGSGINKRYFLSIPGVLTGLGLLVTFLAILVALVDVRIDRMTNQVVGLDGLISGLSGKFVSSVAGLFSATIFMLLEKSIFYRLNTNFKNLAASLDNLFPRLSATQILTEIQRDTSGQSDSFRIFSADLALKLKNSLDQSMVPILEKMVKAIDDLNQFTRSAKEDMISSLSQINILLQKAEESKQDIISTQIQKVIENLERSITSLLIKMGQDFSNALSGSAKDQFEKISSSLESTAELLDKMNSRFEQSQSALESLIENSKESFKEQISIGKDQIIKLSELLGSLSEDMKKTIEETSLKSSEFAISIISDTSKLSAKNTEILNDLLEKHKIELNRVKDLENSLRNILNDFDTSIKSYRQVTSDLMRIAENTKAIVATMEQTSKVLNEGQSSIIKVIDMAKNQIATLGSDYAKQKEVWQSIQQSIVKYEMIFKNVENAAKNLFNEIADGLTKYNEAIRQGFEKILGAANDTMSDAVKRLSGSIDELTTFLDELSEQIEKFNDGRKGDRR